MKTSVPTLSSSAALSIAPPLKAVSSEALMMRRLGFPPPTWEPEAMICVVLTCAALKSFAIFLYLAEKIIESVEVVVSGAGELFSKVTEISPADTVLAETKMLMLPHRPRRSSRCVAAATTVSVDLM